MTSKRSSRISFPPLLSLLCWTAPRAAITLSGGILPRSGSCAWPPGTVTWTWPVRSRTTRKPILPRLLTWAAQPATRTLSPSLAACQAIAPMAIGGLIADMVAVIGSVDIVMGDTDR